MSGPAQPDACPVGAGIVEIECRLDRLLRHQLPDEQFVRSLRSTLLEWSQAVWVSAELLGASIPTANELERGLRLAKRPVFVCGAARSGTSLLRDLLDGHPELVVIPNESAFYTTMVRKLMQIGWDRQRSYLGCWWLGRLVDPPPFWLLGDPALDRSPYLAFARDLAGWWQAFERHDDARIASWPLAAFALAYAQWLGGSRLPPSARMWVEKSPGNERSLAQIWQDFPGAKVIQIIRRPEAVLASIKNMTWRRWTHRRTLAHILREMAPAYRIAANGIRRLSADRFCVVRYEDLTADPEATMLRVARFLEIEPVPSLLRPTVAGRQALNNTSFGTARPELRGLLDPVDRVLLALAVARPAAELGYALADVPTSAAPPIVGTTA